MGLTESGLLSWSEWLALELGEPDWLIPNLLERGGAGLVHGGIQSYKSFLMLRLCLDLSAGKPVLDLFPPAPPRATLLLQAEGSRKAWRRRMLRLQADYPPDIPFWSWHSLTTKLDQAPGDKWVRTALTHTQASLLVVDPIANFFLGADTDPVALQRWRDVSNAWREKYGCAVVWVHHNRQAIRFFADGKVGTFDGGPEEARGRGDIKAWADLILGLRKSGDTTTVSVEKVRDDPTGQEFKFRLDEGKLVLAGRSGDQVEAAILQALIAGDGWLSPLAVEIAGITGVSSSSVRRAIARLVESGEIVQVLYGTRAKLKLTGG